VIDPRGHEIVVWRETDVSFLEDRMLNGKIRDLAVTAIAIVSATVLTALGATAASAATRAPAISGHADMTATSAAKNTTAMPDTTPPTCDTTLPLRACVQVTGAGDTIQHMTGWSWNDGSIGLTAVGWELWNELYYVNQNSRPAVAGTGYVPIVANGSGEKTANCPFTSIPANGNSPSCTWIPTGTDNPVNTGYYCNALWENLPGYPHLVSWKCVYVHP
jgi:hypothetical protein